MSEAGFSVVEEHKMKGQRRHVTGGRNKSGSESKRKKESGLGQGRMEKDKNKLKKRKCNGSNVSF